jgi:glutaredoxin
MEITAYTMPGCSSCGILKELFERASVVYEEVVVKKDVTLENFQSMFPQIRGFPFVVIDGENVGGLVEVAKIFVQKGLVSSKKN